MSAESVIGDGNERDQRGQGDLRESEQPDARDLAGEQAARGHARQEHLDDAARLLLDDAGEHHGSVGRDAHEQQDRHDERGRLVVGGAAGHPAQLDVLDGHGRDEREHLVGVDACGHRPVSNREELDRAGHDRPQLLIGLATPLEPARVDDEHVDVSVPDRLLAGRDALVAVYVCLDADRLALRLDGAWQFGRDGTGHTDVLRASTALEHGGQDDHAGDDDDHHDQRREEGTRTAPLAHLSDRDEPGLARAVHASTAWRNSSDNVGGW